MDHLRVNILFEWRCFVFQNLGESNACIQKQARLDLDTALAVNEQKGMFLIRLWVLDECYL